MIKLEILKQMWRELNRLEKIQFEGWIRHELDVELVTWRNSNGTDKPSN